MGVMPIMRTPKDQAGPRTTFNWFSNAFYWAFFIYACETVIVIWVARARVITFLTDSDRRFDEVIYNIIFMSLLIPHFLLPVASWRYGPQVAIFKNMWTEYQLKFYQVTGISIAFPHHYAVTWFLCVFSWVLGAIVILSQHFLQNDFLFRDTLAYYHILAMLNGFCSLWYVNCTAFKYTSKLFIRHLQETLSSDRPAKQITELRHLWMDLSHMMQQLGKAYAKMYGIYCLVIFITTIIATYGALSEIVDHGATLKELGLFIIVFYCMSLLFIICNEAHHASRNVLYLVQDRLLNVNLTAIDVETRKEVEMFLVAIDKNPPTMNLDGYVDINRGLITSNITFMATYLVVLMQFKMTLLRQAAKQAAIDSMLNATILRGLRQQNATH
ncbi:gustatory and odorant receptor 22 [Culicoides brevitarsis]|uniref:gustatory and odorant receptor 22 n=1 Tax=Culicoides brevitarsis TaxID=469753 RepID=UPI00307B2F15